MGSRLISYRGSGPWSGKSTRSVLDRGDRRLVRLVNGYVSGDGHEIRSMPGFKTLLDLTEENNPDNGFLRVVDDFKLPVYKSPVSEAGTFEGFRGQSGYDFSDLGLDYRDVLTFKVRSRPTHLHGFSQVNGRIVVYGESGARMAPIFKASPGGTVSPSTPGDRMDIEYVHAVDAMSPAPNKWRVYVSQPNAGIIGVPSDRDWSPSGTPRTGWQYIRVTDVVWVEGVKVSDPAKQSIIDATLNNRFARVEGFGALGGHQYYDLTTEAVSPLNGPITPTSTPGIYTTRSNRTNVYSPDGITPYEPDFYQRVDDPDALTIWWVTDPVSVDSPGVSCHPSYVANRQRDFGDLRTDIQVEGVNMTGVSTSRRGISRRRQKSLDYRLNPEKAGRRLILAAPGYSCLFQVPVLIPTTGAGWPAADSAWSPAGGAGVLYPLNDVMDKPRCLGLPKALLVESMHEVTPQTPTNPGPVPYNINLWFTLEDTTPSNHWTSGGNSVYRVAISYQDEATGEEGLASEPITVTIPDDQFTDPTTGAGKVWNFTFQIPLLHPGYIMPECLAFKINVYIGIGATGPLGYYTSLPLSDKWVLDEGDRTAKYGFDAATPGGGPAETQMWRFLVVPIPMHTTSVSDAIDFSRLAPSAANMPRGAECARVIRGILLSVGHSGTHGDGALRRTFLTSAFNTTTPLFWPNEDEIINRALRSPREFSSTPTDSEAEDGDFGLASNYFPSAYQGTEIWSLSLYPEPRKIDTVDIIRNMLSRNTFTPGTASIDNRFELAPDITMAQRLKMKEAPFDADIGTPRGSRTVSRGNVESYHILPRGQIQVGEPGRPDVALTNTIQFLDPAKDDDGVAIGQFGGAAVICSKKETYTLNWRIAPTGETPRLVSRTHGCIAANSMVEFDGGLAWISDRGPVAFTADGLVHIGQDLEEDFFGSNRRYLKDSRGMMRHCWGAHDKSRGLVLWGLVTEDATHTISWEGSDRTYSQADDRGKSRFPCDEILVWSYRANAFSVWRMPSGLEVLWVEEITDENGDQRMAFLAADQRIYVWDDAYQDTNTRPLTHVATSDGSGTSLQTSSFTFGVDGVVVGGISTGLTARGSNNTLMRVGMTVVQTNADGVYKDQTTVASVDFATQTVTFSKSMTWAVNDIFSFGHRPEMEIQTTYIGESITNLDVEAVHLRYWQPWEGNNLAYSWVRCDLLKTDLDAISGSPTESGFTRDSEYQLLGSAGKGNRSGKRLALTQGRSVAPESAVHLKILGQGQVRITDILIEVSG